MNGWLVVVRCNLDDVPLALCGQKKTAMKEIAELDYYTARERIAALHHVLPQWDTTEPLFVDLYRFRNGTLQDVERCRTYQDEAKAA